MYRLVGYTKTKYGYIGYFEQIAEYEDQAHVGIKVKQAYISKKQSENEPELGQIYNVRYYDKTKKEYAFLKK